MPKNLICIETYGTQRVSLPDSEEKVRAYRLDSTTLGRDVLLRLCGSHALDLSLKHAPYHLVNLPAETSFHHGYLLFSLTADELALVEQATRSHSRSHSGLWRWIAKRWYPFSTSIIPNDAFTLVREGPHFDPRPYRASSLTQAETVSTPSVPQHAFVLGQTVYTAHLLRLHLHITLKADHPGEVLMRYQPAHDGSRWYADQGEFAYAVQFEGVEHAFPVFEENLRAEPEGGRFHRDERFPIIPGMRAEAVIELAIKRRLEIPDKRPALDRLQLTKFVEGQTVYYVHRQILTSKNGTEVGYGGRGRVKSASETQVLVYFELAGDIMIHEDDLSLSLPEQVRPRQSLPQPKAPLEEVQAEAQVKTIRIIKPPILETDSVFNAIQRTKHAPLPSLMPHPHRDQLVPIRQEYVGELTGSISGNVYCYGYAVHHDLLLYLNLGGPRMAVEAIRARLSKGEIVNLVPSNAPAIELSAGETEGKANIGKYRTYLNSLSEAKFTSAILVHECLTEPNYADKSITGIFRTSEEQATAKLLHHVRQLVKIAVFDTWAGYLYQAGQSAGLVYQPRSASTIDLVVVDLDASAWTRLITVGLVNQVIDLPHHLTP